MRLAPGACPARPERTDEAGPAAAERRSHPLLRPRADRRIAPPRLAGSKLRMRFSPTTGESRPPGTPDLRLRWSFQLVASSLDKDPSSTWPAPRLTTWCWSLRRD